MRGKVKGWVRSFVIYVRVVEVMKDDGLVLGRCDCWPERNDKSKVNEA